MGSSCCDVDTVNRGDELHPDGPQRRSTREPKYDDELRAKHIRMVEQHHRTIEKHQQ